MSKRITITIDTESGSLQATLPLNISTSPEETVLIYAFPEGDVAFSKIETIKTVRTYTGLGLKESKDIVESRAFQFKSINSGMKWKDFARDMRVAGAHVELQTRTDNSKAYAIRDNLTRILNGLLDAAEERTIPLNMNRNPTAG